jgi:hypothetical protein
LAAEIPPELVEDLRGVLRLSNGNLLPIDPVREEALLGALESELVEGFDSAGDAWTTSPSHQEVTKNLFGVIAARFHELLTETSMQNDHVIVTEALFRSLPHQLDPLDPRFKELPDLARAGYVWRLAEGANGAAAKRWMMQTIRTSFDPGHSRVASLSVAAKDCLAQGVPLGLASPGCLSHGSAIFEGAYWNAIRLYGNPTSGLSDTDRSYAYNFGAAICDVEPFIDALRQS